MIRLRYHHLMCLPRYKGEGYSEEFCQNLDYIKKQLACNNYILVEDCDDICTSCPNCRDGVCSDEEKVKRYDNLVKVFVENGQMPNPDYICSDCRWYYICREIDVQKLKIVLY